jgi:transcriptional regulator with XRE-family HTH domain
MHLMHIILICVSISIKEIDVGLHIMVSYSIEHIGEILKTARIDKKLSQRALAALVGLPQSHISKIERGLVDLQVSSLIQLSRVLDLELMFIPRILVPTVRALQHGIQEKGSGPRPKYRLEEDENEE